MQLQIKIIGFVLIALALVHIIFPKYFNWKQELKPLTLINRQLMYVHTFFIALAVLLMGLICIFSADEIISTNLGKRLALGFAVFWGFRLFFQFFVYSPSLWKGKLFETTIHVVFTLLWTYLTLIFFFISMQL